MQKHTKNCFIKAAICGVIITANLIYASLAFGYAFTHAFSLNSLFLTGSACTILGFSALFAVAASDYIHMAR